MSAHVDSAFQNDTWTYAEYAQLPESAPYELIHGELVREPSPAFRHQDIVAELTMHMRRHVQEQSLGVVVPAPTDVRFSDTVTLHPDVLFVSNKRRDRITERYIDGAPDLVVEILSPSTAERDRTTKRDIYERHKVEEYWLVDPDAETVEVLSNTADGFVRGRLVQRDDILTSGVLTGLRIQATALFGES